MPEPARARAIFSTEDFKLLREAVRHYIQAHEDDPATSKFVHLYHRLGSGPR